MPAFRVAGVEYEFPTLDSLTANEAVLVRQLTGMDIEKEWAVEINQDPPSLIAIIGLLGIAVSRANPDWTREQVRGYAGNVDLAAMKTIQSETDLPPDPAGDGENQSPAS